MKLPLYWADAFTSRVGSGNPAAVVPLSAWLPDADMLRIAAENGLSETAFFVPVGPDRWHLRWFTPTVEMDLCGHATLATAFTLLMELGATSETLTFDSRSGPLLVREVSPPGRDGRWLELDFPARSVVEELSSETRRQVSETLGADVAWLGRSNNDLLADLGTPDAVRNLQRDDAAIARLGFRAVLVTAEGDDCDFVSRFFAPGSGIAEDPATGSAHCVLAPFWAQRLGKTRMQARQLSARGAELLCEVRGDRVGIAGQAVMYLRGEIEI
jgi:PhzF family phenazine biosynthesis protein